MVPEMLENEVNDESNVETFVVGGDNYTVLILLLLLHTLFFLFQTLFFFFNSGERQLNQILFSICPLFDSWECCACKAV